MNLQCPKTKIRIVTRMMDWNQEGSSARAFEQVTLDGKCTGTYYVTYTQK